MAHFAQIDASNVVVQVVVVANEDLGNAEFPASEAVGVAKLQQLFPGTQWKQTSYNNNFRVRYAGVGFVYSEQHDAFIPPKPFDSFVFNEVTLDWNPPVPQPDDGGMYVWSEQSLSWEPVQ